MNTWTTDYEYKPGDIKLYIWYRDDLWRESQILRIYFVKYPEQNNYTEVKVKLADAVTDITFPLHKWGLYEVAPTMGSKITYKINNLLRSFR